MRLFHSVHILHRPLAVILIQLVVFGCYGWKATAVTPQVLVETQHPKVVRVAIAGGVDTVSAGTHSVALVVRASTSQVVEEPRIAADTLRGLYGRDSVAVALRDITRVEVRRFDGRATGLGLALLGAAAFIVYWGIACEDNPYC
jgi:hypothetical protein